MLAAEKNSQLPSPPGTVLALLEATRRPNTPLRRIAGLVAGDPVLSAEILRITNSSLYSQGAEISSVHRAVSRMGSRAIRNLALCSAVRNAAVASELGALDLDAFWKDSLCRALAGRLLAESLNDTSIDASEVFTTGLMQDVGVIVLIRSQPEKSEAWMALRGLPNEQRRDSERELFGESHDDAAQRLVEAWGLPREIKIPVCMHHTPQESPPEFRVRSQLAHDADVLADVFTSTDSLRALTRARAQLEENYGLSHAQTESLLMELDSRLATIAEELGFSIEHEGAFEALVTAAQSGLVEDHLTYEELVVELQRARAENEMLRARAAANDRRLEEMSLADGATGLPNGRALTGRIRYEVRRVARGGAAAFFLAQIPELRPLSRAHGPKFRDQLLKHIAGSLGAALRDVDLVSRVRPEIFGLLLVGADPKGASIACKRLADTLATRLITAPDGSEHSLSLRLGGAWIEGPFRGELQPAELAKRLMHEADAALSQASDSEDEVSAPLGTPIAWETGPG